MNMVINAVLLSFLFISGVSTCHQDKNLKMSFPRLEALAGSCLLIPCEFTVSNTRLEDNLAGWWIRTRPNLNNVVYNSANERNQYSMKFTGNLAKGNCTTIFSDLVKNYQDEYFFRIESTQYTATASCDALHINVYDSPPSPKLEVSGELKEKKSVTLSCSAATPCPHAPPNLSWNCQENLTTTVDNNTDQTLVSKIQKTITLSDKDDGLLIRCCAEYPVKNDLKRAEGNLVLNVSYSPKNTSVTIHPSDFVPAGSSVKLTCLSKANPPVSNFTWFQKGIEGFTRVSYSENYTVFNVTHTKVLYCLAENDLGSGRSEEIQLRGATQETIWIWIWIISGGIISFIVLVCLIVSVWTLKSRIQTHQCRQAELQIQLTEGLASDLHETTDQVHYGEIDFSKRNLYQTSATVENSGQQQETVYAEVRVPRSSTGTTPAVADPPGDV